MRSFLVCFPASATCVLEERIMSGYEWMALVSERDLVWSAQEALYCNTTSFSKRSARAILWWNLIFPDVPKGTEFGKGTLLISMSFLVAPAQPHSAPLLFPQDFVRTGPSASEDFSLMSTLVVRPHAKQACPPCAALLSHKQLLYVKCDIFDHIPSVLKWRNWQ